MQNGLIALLVVTLLWVWAAIIFCCGHAYRLFKRIHGVAPFPIGFGFSNFMCTMLMPGWFRGRQALLASQSPQARIEIEGVARRMRIVILSAVALVVLASIAMIVAARP